MRQVQIRAKMKETDKAFVFLSSSPRIYKGDFLNSIISLPKSKVNIIEVKEVAMSLKDYVVEMPQWLFDTIPFGESEWKNLIKVII